MHLIPASTQLGADGRTQTDYEYLLTMSAGTVLTVELGGTLSIT